MIAMTSTGNWVTGLGDVNNLKFGDILMPNEQSKATSQSPVIIYTDGGCSPNPGRGGWAALLAYKEHKKLISGCYRHSTNNRMEIIAVLEALRAVRAKACYLKVHTDSQYIANAWNQGWLVDWQSRGWVRRKAKNPLKNLDLWQELMRLTSSHHVEFIWVKGHSGIQGNEIVDAEATQARLTAKPVIDRPYEALTA